MKQFSLEIKTHDFKAAMTGLKQYNDERSPLPQIPEVEEKSWWCFDHDVSGEELNKVVRQIQSCFFNHQGLFIRVLDEFNTVYKAFEALDKDYISGIVGSIRAAEKVSIDEQKDRADIKELVEDIEKSVVVLMRFKSEIEKLKTSVERVRHLSDIDLMWDNAARLADRVQTVNDDMKSALKTLVELREADERLRRKIRGIGVLAFLSILSSAIFFLLNVFVLWKW